MINSKFLFAVLAVTMLLAASGCVSIIRVPGSNETDDEDVATLIEGFEGEEDVSKGLPTKTVNEGEFVSFPNLNAVDPDGDAILYTFTEPLDENGEWQTARGDAGNYEVTITASDGATQVSQNVMVIVKSLNKAPVIDALDDISIEEGETVLINPVVSDGDGDDVEITFSGWMDSSKKKSDYDDAGTHTVTIIATDGKESVTQTVGITVVNVNRAPVVEGVADIAIDEGDNVGAALEVSDPDGDDVELTFSEPLDADGEWSTEIGDAGKYMVRATASDGDLETQESFYVTVNAVNLAPVLEGVADVEVDESEVVSLSVTAVDPEGDDVEITFSEPLDADGTWETGYSDSGTYVVTVTASDGISSAEETFTITVNDVNRAPTFAEGAFD